MKELNLKQKRVMMFFIEATQELIFEEGIENISIKKIATRAGYNSATIYNYFENLEVLILYASVNHLKTYLKDLKNEIKTDMKARDIYKTIYKFFVYHSFRRPEIFHILFFGKYSHKLGTIIKRYYEIFPNEIEGHLDLTRSMLIEGFIHNRDLPIIKQMIKEGSIQENKAMFIMESIVRIHHSYLEDLLQKNIELSLEEYSDKFFNIFNFLLEKF